MNGAQRTWKHNDPWRLANDDGGFASFGVGGEAEVVDDVDEDPSVGAEFGDGVT